MDDKRKPDWSEGNLKKHIVEQRKFLWRDDTIEMYAAWMGLRQGMTVIDAGCGLGYLGWTYWKHFGRKGRYLGVDISLRLIEQAVEMKKSWAKGGKACFCTGNVFKLPFPDDCADWTMCQTLLMHLEQPEKALTEMIRVTKPGGLIMCNEPDNISSSMKVVYSSAYKPDISELLQQHKMTLKWAEGRRKLGKGDWGIGIRVPYMMHDLGLEDIDIRCNDKAHLLQLPYDTPEKMYRRDMLIDQLNKDEKENKAEKKRQQKDFRENYIAGGGSLSSFYREVKIGNKKREEVRSTMRKQLDEDSFFVCGGSGSFFCIIGRKKSRRHV